MQTGSSGTLIGWKSGQTTFVPLWDRMEGAWLRTQDPQAFKVYVEFMHCVYLYCSLDSLSVLSRSLLDDRLCFTR
jgi:hypothetical protein